jgi:unsaturated rhamnogalacturonyl hydrolase
MAQTNMSAQMADSMMARCQDLKWHYDHGFLVYAIHHVGLRTGQHKYLDFGRRYVDTFVQQDGSIRTYLDDEFNLDQVNPGKNLFLVWKASHDDRYRKAIEILRDQLRHHPRTPSRGFWHKQIYPNQMWLDGVFMASPFYAEYGQAFGEGQAFDDIIHQVKLLESHARDPKTGLLYHAWDESHAQRWADKESGCSPHFWGRAMGWFAMALVDILDYFPKEHKDRPELVASLGRLAAAVARVQDRSGLYWQVLDQPERQGNYLESSATGMFAYALAKGARMAYIDRDRYLTVAKKAYEGLVNARITRDSDGQVSLQGVCSVAGLGGNPYRDGSFEYYISEKVVANDYKGVGAFILAALELEAAD